MFRTATLEAGAFYIEANTGLTCPQCGRGELISRKNNIHILEYENYNKKTREESKEFWEYEWFKFAFVGYLECDNNKCNEKIAFAGKLEESESGHPSDDEQEYINEISQRCYPEYFERPPQIIRISEVYPAEIKDVLDSSFKLFWIDRQSCANKIRVSIEILLDHLKIKKYPKSGRRIPLSIQQRINIMAAKAPDISEKLTAVKWIGNAGSHTDQLSRKDLLDAYKILNYSLEKVFINEEAEINKISREINKRKRPRKK